MISVPLLSQRDSRWKDIKLGFSDVTIGNFGCVITSLTSLAQRSDVSVTNELFKSNGVYLKPNLVIWGNVPKVFTGLRFVWRSNGYDNNIVANWVYGKKTPVVVQVNAAPIGSPRTDHYILFVGDKKCFDPWTGKIRPTSDFPILKGYALYEKA